MILDKLRELNEEVPKPPKLPDEELLQNVEFEFSFKFPHSYRKYQLEYSDVTVGSIELFWLFQSNDYLDIRKQNDQARKIGLPETLIAFAQDNGDYFCIDTTKDDLEDSIVCWLHNIQKIEKRWDGFLDWVENYWLTEYA